MRPKARRLDVVMVLTVVVVSAGCTPSDQPVDHPHAVARLGDTRNLATDFLGINGANFRFGRELWTTGAFRHALADLAPPAFRVFGGTTANFWDWRAGEFSDEPAVPQELARYRDAQPALPFEAMASAVTAGRSSPIFVLNMVTSTRDEQIEMLHRAQELGLPVTRVELGNELAGNDTSSVFPSGDAYGRVANEWIVALKSAFPEVQVAISANAPAGEKDVSSRKRNWTPQLFAVQRGADAAVFHPYYRLDAAGGPQDVSRAAAEVPIAADARMRELDKSLDDLPAGMEAWITEFNLLDRSAPVHGTWAQGLALASFTVLLAQDSRVAQADVHALVGNAVFAALFQSDDAFAFGADEAGFLGPSPAPATQPLALGATGVAARALFHAFRGATSAQTLDFTSGPRTGGHVPSVLGLLVDGAGRRAVLVNRDETAVTIGLPGSLNDMTATTVAAPAWTLVNGAASVPQTKVSVSGKLLLPAHSLTIVR